MASVIIALSYGDPVEADKILSREASCIQSNEGEIARGLIDSFQTFDQDSLQSLQKKSVLKFLDNEVT